MNTFAGIGLKVLSALVFTVMTALVKILATDYPTGQIVFSRSLFALVPLTAMLVAQRQFPAALRTARPFGHVLRGVFGGASMSLGFAAVAFLPLPDVVALGYAAPLMTLAMAPFLLGEKVGIYRWSAVALGLAGVLLILSPHLGAGATADGAGTGAALALLGALGTSIAMIQVRRLTITETNGAIVFYFSLVTTALGLATLPFGWEMPDTKGAALLVCIGLMGGVGQILLTQSYRLAPASTIAPFDYTTMLWALGIGFAVFGEVPAPVVFVGAAIVMAAGIFVILRERQLGIERARTAGIRQTPL